jgi:hypothetical protein
MTAGSFFLLLCGMPVLTPTDLLVSLCSYFSVLLRLKVGQVLSSVIPKGSGTGFKCKVVKRKYAFDDVEIPREETEYLKVRKYYQNTKMRGSENFERLCASPSNE